jgi:hypothetical protein
MRRRLQILAADETQAARFARLAAFMATVALVALLGFVRSAEASTVPTPTKPAPPVEVEEEFLFGAGGEAEEEDELEACEELSNETAAEACEAKVEEREVFEACNLSAAEATVAARPGRDRIRLAIHYRSLSPATVRIGVRFHGGKGSGNLGQSTAHLSQSGTFRESIRLDDPVMTRALAAREFTVTLRIAGAPSRCTSEFDQALSSRRAVGRALVWSDPDPSRS